MAANIIQFRLVNDKAAKDLPFGWYEKENRQVESPGIGILNLTEKFTCMPVVQAIFYCDSYLTGPAEMES